MKKNINIKSKFLRYFSGVFGALSILYTVPSLVYAQTAPPPVEDPSLTITDIISLQPPGYTFDDWTTDMTCSFVDYNAEANTQRVVSFVAVSGSNPPVIRQSIRANTQEPHRGNFGNITNNMGVTIKTYNDPSVTTTVVPTSNSTGGGRSFSYATDKGNREVVLYPTGFYLKISGNRYLGGC